MQQTPTWRVLDTGLRSAAQNIALNRALLEARQAGETPSTLRFLRFFPSALLGYHQSAEQELDLAHCRAHGIAVQRRITGGGAIYFDEGQIGWELYLHRHEIPETDLTGISRRICEAAARGIATLGVEARFRPRNDIEVAGRKISGTGGIFDGDALMFQGTLLVDFDVEKMLRALRIPAEKLSGKAIASARERVTSLAELLGQAPSLDRVKDILSHALAGEFGVALAPGELLATENARYHAALEEIDDDAWINQIARPDTEMPLFEAAQKFPGGMLRVALAYDSVRRRIAQAWFSGDFFVAPRRCVADLEAVLRNLQAEQAEAAIRAFFAARAVDMLQLTPDDFVSVVQQGLSHAR